MVGRAAHEAISHYVMGMDLDQAIDLAADAHHVERDDFAWYCKSADWLWRTRIKDEFDDYRVEVKLEGKFIYGFADLLATGGNSIIVLDWKTGYSDPSSYKYQLLAYAMACLEQQEPGWDGEIECWVVTLADQQIHQRTYTRRQIEAFEVTFRNRLSRVGKDYGPGGHCTYCKHINTCHAYGAWVQTTLGILADQRINSSMPTEQLLSIKPKVDALKRTIDNYESAVREQLSARGPLTVDNINYYANVSERKSLVRGIEPYNQIVNHMSEDDAQTCVQIDLTRARKIVRDSAERGSKKLAESVMLDELADAGLIEVTAQTKISKRTVETDES